MLDGVRGGCPPHDTPQVGCREASTRGCAVDNVEHILDDDGAMPLLAGASAHELGREFGEPSEAASEPANRPGEYTLSEAEEEEEGDGKKEGGKVDEEKAK